MGQGIFTAEDLARSLAQWDEPLRLRVWDHDLWTMPPPSQGYLTLASAWIAEQRGIGSRPVGSAVGAPGHRGISRRRARSPDRSL